MVEATVGRIERGTPGLFHAHSVWIEIIFKCGEEQVDVRGIGFSDAPEQILCIVSWDLKTGGVVSDIGVERVGCESISFSGCGTMFGCLFGYLGKTLITRNILPGTQMASHSVQESAINTIWYECIFWTKMYEGVLWTELTISHQFTHSHW
jgi:hypothetical protein